MKKQKSYAFSRVSEFDNTWICFDCFYKSCVSDDCETLIEVVCAENKSTIFKIKDNYHPIINCSLYKPDAVYNSG
jgi:hypothetical protein